MGNLYNFKCSDCDTEDTRVAAFFEDVATCHLCGGLMYRLDDPFALERADQDYAKAVELYGAIAKATEAP